jgi:hypothetical protein
MENIGIFYDHLVYLVVIWYIFHRFGILYQEKYGNPALRSVYTRTVIFVSRDVVQN